MNDYSKNGEYVFQRLHTSICNIYLSFLYVKMATFEFNTLISPFLFTFDYILSQISNSPSICDNGIVEGNEQCDCGSDVVSISISSSCSWPSCC